MSVVRAEKSLNKSHYFQVDNNITEKSSKSLGGSINAEQTKTEIQSRLWALRGVTGSSQDSYCRMMGKKKSKQRLKLPLYLSKMNFYYCEYKKKF